MTLANLVLTAERIMLVTETLAGCASAPVCFTTKFELLAHITAVMAARGPDDFRHETRLFLDHAHLFAGVETAAELRRPVRSWLSRDWKWAIGTVIAIVGAAATVLAAIAAFS